jgi:hypothetical protein
LKLVGLLAMMLLVGLLAVMLLGQGMRWVLVTKSLWVEVVAGSRRRERLAEVGCHQLVVHLQVAALLTLSCPGCCWALAVVRQRLAVPLALGLRWVLAVVSLWVVVVVHRLSLLAQLARERVMLHLLLLLLLLGMVPQG